jgi:hypothetical protein
MTSECSVGGRLLFYHLTTGVVWPSLLFDDFFNYVLSDIIYMTSVTWYNERQASTGIYCFCIIYNEEIE